MRLRWNVRHARQAGPRSGLLRRMNNAQAHRGPDGEGYHLEPGVALGHRRLSIIDIAAGAQPLYNEDKSVVVAFNGEIYNFQDLVPELQRLGHVFDTRSDTEVIVHAWEAWGRRCVDRFRGMFAFALYDRNKDVLFLARDRLGVKPLFYSMLPDGLLIFGSELKSLMAHPALESGHRFSCRGGVLRPGLRRGAALHLASVRKLSQAHVWEVEQGRATQGTVPVLGSKDQLRQPADGEGAERNFARGCGRSSGSL